MVRKRDKLYIVNRWNQPLFAQGVDREHNNIFDGLGSSALNTNISSGANGWNWGSNTGTADWLDGTSFGNFLSQTNYNNYQNSGYANYGVRQLTGTPSYTLSSDALSGLSAAQQATQQTADASSGTSKTGSSSWGKAGIAAGLAAAGSIGKSEKFKRGAYDALDPLHHLAGGRESTIGNGLGDAGVSVFNAGAQSGNGYMMIAGAALKAGGSLWNTLAGYKLNKENIAKVENSNALTRDNSAKLASSQTTEDFFNTASSIRGAGHKMSLDEVGKDSVFNKGATNKMNSLNKETAQVDSYAAHGMTLGAQNVSKNMNESAFANSAAFGGPLSMMGDSTGAIDYGFMSDYLTNKRKAVEAKNRVPNSIFNTLQAAPLSTFALGGDLQIDGGDYSNGLTHIDAGGSHEENPYQGVQMGISRENGNPNLLEQDETVFNDYVYSKRIKADSETKKKFHVNKNTEISFADLSKKIEKESLERPNDPISQNALKKQLSMLAEEQERQKVEQQAKEEAEAQAAFEQLPPEQQQAIMQQMAMQEQQEQQQAQEEQLMEQQAQQQDMQGNMPEDNGQQLSAEQQQMLAQQEGQEEQLQQPQMEETQMAACGGKINRFDNGGRANRIKTGIYNALNKVVKGGIYTDSDFKKWLAAQKLQDITDWENLSKNTAFMDALKKVSPALRDAMSRGYNFDPYSPSQSKALTFDFLHGGWGQEDYASWKDSKDPAWLEAVEAGKVNDQMTSEEIGEALKSTAAYRRGTDWLKADESNRLRYLQQIFNSKEAPEAAKAYAAKFVDANGWLEDAKRDYQTIFEDPNNVGVRNTHPGTYWKTPIEVARDKAAINYVVNPDGSVEEIVGDVPKAWKNLGSYNWLKDNVDTSANYFERPIEATPATVEAPETEAKKSKKPIHLPTWGREAALGAPLVSLAMKASGIGAPDYSRIDKAVSSLGSPVYATYKPISSYLRYSPMDIWYEQNRLNANSRATDRAIANSASPIGTKMAGWLANNLNNQTASADLYKKGLEYNDALRLQKANFDRDTDKFNAEAFNTTSRTNAEIANSHRRARSQMQMDAAKERLNTDASWYQGIYKDVGNIFTGLGNWGKENQQHNMIANMAADAIFGPMRGQYITQDYLQDAEENVRKGKRKVISAKGGKISRKKGLTI